MSKESVLRLHNLIHHLLDRPNNKGQPLSSLHQLLVCLHHLGSGSYQRATADRFNVSQFCSWKINEHVLDALLTLELQFLYYPTVAESWRDSKSLTYIWE